MSDNNPGSQGNSPYGQQNQPQYGQNPPQYGQQSPSPYGQQSPSPYGQQGQYGSGAGNYPGQQGYQGQPAENPGRTLGIIGLILAIFLAPIGLIVSIVALVKSRKAGMRNGLALAGIIVGALLTILWTVLIIVIASFATDLAQQIIQACEGQPTGTPVTVQGQPVECP